MLLKPSFNRAQCQNAVKAKTSMPALSRPTINSALKGTSNVRRVQHSCTPTTTTTITSIIITTASKNFSLKFQSSARTPPPPPPQSLSHSHQQHHHHRTQAKQTKLHTRSTYSTQSASRGMSVRESEENVLLQALVPLIGALYVADSEDKEEEEEEEGENEESQEGVYSDSDSDDEYDSDEEEDERDEQWKQEKRAILAAKRNSQEHTGMLAYSVLEEHEESVPDIRNFFSMAGLGGLLGFAAGYAGKKSLKFLMILIGGEFVLLQVMSYAGYLEVNWDRVLHVTDPYLHDKKRQHSVAEKAKAILTHNVPFKVGVLSGFAVGFKYG